MTVAIAENIKFVKGGSGGTSRAPSPTQKIAPLPYRCGAINKKTEHGYDFL